MTNLNERTFSSDDETGSVGSDHKLVIRKLGPYKVTIRLTATNEFVDIVAVQIEADFLSIEQRIRNRGFHDVSDLYESEES